MRAPGRRRPHRTDRSDPPASVDLVEVASRVRYVGSAEHKSYPLFAGGPALRSDASRCPPRFDDPDMLTGWLRTAIRGGQCGGAWSGVYPRYVWYRDGEECYEGRLVNQEAGWYKGYPTDCPEWLP